MGWLRRRQERSAERHCRWSVESDALAAFGADSSSRWKSLSRSTSRCRSDALPHRVRSSQLRVCRQVCPASSAAATDAWRTSTVARINGTGDMASGQVLSRCGPAIALQAAGCEGHRPGRLPSPCLDASPGSCRGETRSSWTWASRTAMDDARRRGSPGACRAGIHHSLAATVPARQAFRGPGGSPRDQRRKSRLISRKSGVPARLSHSKTTISALTISAP